MKILAVTMVKNESDVIEHVVNHLFAQGVDEIVVADNMSTDGTREILEGLPVTLVDDLDPAYYQSEKITRLVHQFASPDCWVVPFDADELWCGTEGRTLREELLQSEADVLVAPVYDFIPQPSDSDDPNPFKRIVWRESTPEVWGVIAFKYHPDAVVLQGAHNVTHPGSRASALRVSHYQYRSYEQFVRKLRNGRKAYEATDLAKDVGEHWRTLGGLTNSELLVKWNELLATPDLVFDPCL